MVIYMVISEKMLSVDGKAVVIIINLLVGEAVRLGRRMWRLCCCWLAAISGWLTLTVD